MHPATYELTSQNKKRRSLALERWSVFIADSHFGAKAAVSHGEAVFNTGMSGCVRGLTRSILFGQIVHYDHAQVGNYGINAEGQKESRRAKSCRLCCA